MHRFDVQSPEQQAERAANKHYRALQGEVLGVVRYRLAARKMHLDESDLEEAYCQAWHGVCETIKQGEPVSNLTGLLIEISWRRTVDLYRELRPGQRVDLKVDEHLVGLDVDAQLDDRIKFKRFVALVRGRLSPRECEAVSLCVIHGYSRPEAAKLLGLTRRQMEKLMDGATKKIGGIVASISTRGCGGDEWSRLIRSYALGLIAEDDRDYPRAVAHIAECEACQRYVDGLRGLAAFLPPIVPFGPFADAGHGASLLEHLARLLRAGHGRIAGPGSALRTAGAGAGTGASAGAAGSTGGGSLLSTLGTGTITKGVIVVAGATALVLATHNDSHHVATHRAPPAQARTPLPVSVSASVIPRALPPIGRPSDATTSNIRPHHLVASRKLVAEKPAVAQRSKPPTPDQAQSEFGIENQRSASPTPTPAPAAPRPAPKENASSASVNREFGFER
ncbi:MAG: sigma-70 family RNA polymerase sigma factor [Solirubrobacteraceae bacterium]